MRVAILAAGRGSRMEGYTENLPKGMLPLRGHPLLAYQLSALRRAGVDDIYIATGFRPEAFQFDRVRYFHNPNWADTNMVATLFCEPALFRGDDDLLVSYADILFEPSIIAALPQSGYSLAKVIDTDYRAYWSARNGDYRQDSESCTLNPDNTIAEIGEDGVVDDVRLHGRDVGLTYISKSMAPRVLDFYLAHKELYWEQPSVHGRSVKRWNMTDLVQAWIEHGWSVSAACIRRGWLELDTANDYEKVQEWLSTGRIEEFIRFDSLEQCE
ncbi:MAG: phosphocholine cytidylyltransferase family protein [Bdellovibrionales bacterium]|nr:phosphocholine cytidylyltransferase family protein [Bdellovibrionales bacterium]